MTKQAKEILVAIIGAGGVGGHFLTQLATLVNQTPALNVSLCYLGIIDRVYWTSDYSAIDLANALDILAEKGQDPISLEQTIDYLAKAPSKVILIDNTSVQSIADLYPRILGSGISIVTPNKKAFSGTYDLWKEAFEAARSGGSLIEHECTVGAALPVLSTLRTLIAAGDDIHRIEGVFSGTMTYLFSTFSPVDGPASTARWSDVVKKARELGYTEPDPRDDLNGMDVARKLTILARIAGLKTESATSFPVKSLVPQALETVPSATEYLEKLPAYDHEMDELRATAEQHNNVLRFVGSVDVQSGALSVGLRQLPKMHPAAQLVSSDNIFSFYTKRYGDRPLIIKGAGAGGEVTAMGVLAGLLKTVDRLN
ncbi:hypothetical protein LTR84_008849 [Exophiala bonariae]|uniref:Homoserine dehydrogenase n=1 Tax=Exophiala bonariae TaxID=1690606 RepID=A0AAV9MVT1_9EURO|nr:hypothetical protein LTR84_008849 [Exophiala bonariae]